MRPIVPAILFTFQLLVAQPHVIVVGLDGCSPDGMAKSGTTVFADLQRRGAWTMHARGVMPTVSSPNWASMIMGAGPEQHGITSNEWERDKAAFPPVFAGYDGIFPTIFGLLRKQKPDSTIGVFHDWQGFGRLVERGAASELQHPKGPQATMDAAIAFWRARKPDLLFIHLDHVDHAGHEKGHGTPEYYASVREAGALITKLLEAVGSTPHYLIITSDHGGVGKKHGGNTLAELEIPWIITGPDVRSGHELKFSVNTYDTAATIAHLFKLMKPQAWVGRAVLEAFSK